MANKIKPTGMRLQVNRTWNSRWYADTKDYGDLLQEDLKIREFINDECKQAGVARVIIERPHKKCRVTIHTARPGVIIGKKGADIEVLRKKLAALTDSELHLNIVEVRKPELDAQLVGESIAQQLERRVSFRRAMKRAVQNAMRMGALGIRVNVAGRLGGAEIARTEWYKEGRVPLHTLRADIDYAHSEATTAYGVIGIKVWVFKGEIMGHDTALASNPTHNPEHGTDLNTSIVSSGAQAIVATPSSVDFAKNTAESVGEVQEKMVSAITEQSIHPGQLLGLDDMLMLAGVQSPTPVFLAALSQMCSSANPLLKLKGYSLSSNDTDTPMSDSDIWAALQGTGERAEEIAIRFEVRRYQ